MWETKKFKTLESKTKWLEKNDHKIQWNVVIINNVNYAIEYRKLRRVY
jgi:hypothetical protein